jgi:hypothetical protein
MYAIYTHPGKPGESMPRRASSRVTARRTMEHYRCACGKTESFASIQPFPCESCPECGSTLGQRPEQVRLPAPHQYSVWGRCLRCHTPK